MARIIMLGKMIDYYRKSNRLTLEDLGKKLGKSPSAISRWLPSKANQYAGG